ncbi:MAG: Na+/H+ antiporter NhaC family protein [Planctomycetota bacterium]|jgi:Na+/H+ antiporter NhaC
MTGSLRWLLAAAFVVLFALLPSADDRQVALLKTRAWLLDDDGSPLAAALADPGAPVPVLQSEILPPGPEADELADAFARTGREWARSHGRTLAPEAPPLRLTLRVGDNGFEAAVFDTQGTPIGAPLRYLKTPVEGEASAGYFPNRLSLLPAFLAIVLAIVTGRVIPSLLAGCLAGALLYTDLSPTGGVSHLALGIAWGRILTDSFNQEILGFVIFLFMTVGVMARSGGIQGMVAWVSRFAKGPVSTQICSWAIGILVFFDDYSNCIITGSTMRPLTDRNGVSREKLAYIVDATAAPIAGISIFSTWVAYEVSMFALQLPEVTQADGITPFRQADGFAVFVQTLPFRFYCIFTIATVLLTILLRREFGPMLAAERRAHHERKPVADDARPMVAEDLDRTEPPEGAPLLGRNAFLPILLLVSATVFLVFRQGTATLAAEDPGALSLPLLERIPKILGGGESQRALFYASIGACALAMLLAIGQRILTVGDAVQSAVRSAKSLGFAIIILVLAWSIGAVCKDLGTAQFLTAAFHGSFQPWLLPIVLFITSALVAFSTGTSYGTMAILLPNVVVLAHVMGSEVPELGGVGLMILTIGAVLEGSIFGDHCSPISDTTVLSSVSTGCDHLHHVRTQAPYAVAVMAIATVCGYLPAALLGPSYWPLSWLLGLAAIVGLLLIVGRDPRRAHGGA